MKPLRFDKNDTNILKIFSDKMVVVCSTFLMILKGERKEYNLRDTFSKKLSIYN